MRKSCLVVLLCASVLIGLLGNVEAKSKPKPDTNDEEDYDFLNDLEDDENESEEFCDWQKCDKVLSEPTGLKSVVDVGFIGKVLRNLNPFSSPQKLMRFFLFQREFHDCGREMRVQDESMDNAGFNASLPTRILIHGWMSQSRGSFNRDVKNAYLNRSDFNVIVADWSRTASNMNYFSVARMMDSFGAQVARFTSQLVDRLGAKYDDMYLIGHSLGAQIAGSAGKQIKPEQYNTIFALDPAGPKFRLRSDEFRIDPTDARYVESIQTSANLGFLEPRGLATFFPNYGFRQTACYFLGCSHVRAYKMFAESIVSKLGFWGTRCENHNMPHHQYLESQKARLENKSKENDGAENSDDEDWKCNEDARREFVMGGEPSQPKKGVFYVKTAKEEPFAMGR